MTTDLANYIDNELKEMLPNFKWRIVKDSKKNLVEIYVTFRVETEEEIQVQDIVGTNNEPGCVQFEDVLCFYDPAYSHLKPQNYLASFHFDSHTGVDKGFVDAVLRQLNHTTKQGKMELKEFLLDDFAGEFSLTWNSNSLESFIQTYKDTNRYSEEKLNMVLEEEKSFMEKIKKDDNNGGVERV